MKNQKTLNQLSIIALLGILLFSCDTSEKDWTKAKLANNKTEYQTFINKHSKSNFAEKAQMALDSFEWVCVLKTHNVDSLEFFLKNYASSKFIATSKIALDSIEWNIAYFSRDSLKLRNYINKYPNSSYKQKVEDIIWEVKWSPIKIEKANSLIIWEKNDFVKKGSFSYYRQGRGMIQVIGMQPEVFIFRSFYGRYAQLEKKLGLFTGIAYLYEAPDKFKAIKKVDLSKTNEQLCTEFGLKY